MNRFNWRHKISDWIVSIIASLHTPLPLKECAWSVARFIARCGKANALSFALRPILLHGRFRLFVGAFLIFVSALFVADAPIGIAANIGGEVVLNLNININEEPEEIRTISTVGNPLAQSEYTITQRYWVFHSGVDMAAEIGTPVYPAMPGVVSNVENSSFGYGRHVIVSHNGEYESLYAHLSKIEVEKGQTVDLNMKIGEVGNTGRSTGPHLHFEIRQNGRPFNPLVLIEL